MRFLLLLLLLGIIIIGSVQLSGGSVGFSSDPLIDPTPTSTTPTPTQSVQYVPIADTPGPAQSTLHLQVIAMGTITPTPTPGPISTPTPVINLSSAGFDYEDLATTITDVCDQTTAFKAEACPMFKWECPILSNECVTELNQAIAVEIGTINSSLPGDPGTRVNLCSQNPSCVANGYDHYTGAVPLPVPNLSDTCKQEFTTCFNESPVRTETGLTATQLATIQEVIRDQQYSECDLSDHICTLANAH